MDIIKKCQLITGNTLIHSAGRGYDYELNIEMYTELKNEIIEKLESIINPIIEEYKKHEKNLFCKEFNVDMDYKIDNSFDLLKESSMASKDKINEYITLLIKVEERIEESKKKFDELKNTTTIVSQ